MDPWHEAALAAAAGIAALVLSFVVIDEHSAAWPPNATQLISVLLLATAIEQRAFKAPPPLLLWISFGFLLLVTAALIDAILRASAGHAFTAVEAALVNGCTAGLAVLVITLALPQQGDVVPTPGQHPEAPAADEGVQTARRP